MMRIIRKKVPCVWLLTTAAAVIPIVLNAQSQADQAVGNTRTEVREQGSSKAAGFLKDAARNNELEISLAEIGARKAENQQLKTFCEHLQQDHLQLDKQLKPLAQQYGVTLDQNLSRKGTRTETKLDKLTGPKFDQQLATDLLKQHQKAINTFEKALQENQPTDVQQFAQATMPKLQQHFQEAQNTAKAVGVDESTISSIARGAHQAMGGTADGQEGSDLGSGQKTDKGAGAKQLEQNQPPPQR